MRTPLYAGIMLLLVSLSQLPAAVLYVDLNSPTPTPPYTDWNTAAVTIQDAVDASSAGDTILVTNGVYQTGGWPAAGEILTNRVLVTNALTLQSVNGPEVTVIAGYQVPSSLVGDAAVRCAHLADGTTLSGFSLVDGATRQLTTTNLDAQGYGGGVWCQSTNVMVTNCIVVSNSCSFYGGGIYSGSVRGCQIENNGTLSGALGGGGGVAYSIVSDSVIRSNYATGGPTFAPGGAWACVVSNSVIEGNLQGGAHYCLLYSCSILNNSNQYSGGGATQSLLNNCTVSGNYTRLHGGGVYNCTLYSSIVCSNQAAEWGGGVHYDDQTNTMGRNNLVCGNFGSYAGGGVYLDIGYSPQTNTWDLVNWTVVSNSTAGTGGGLVWLSPARLQLDGSTFARNYAAGSGGGLYVTSAFPPSTLSNCTFTGNVALGNGGGAYNAALVNCLVISNQAVYGGGLYGAATNCVFTGNIASANGGGLLPAGPPGVVLGCAFTNNSAVNGGAASSGTFANCSFVANSALTNGGALYRSALSNCLVMSNTAAFGGGVFTSSGTANYPFTLYNCLNSQFIGNTAHTDGGGLYLPSSFSVTNCLVQGNTALNNGGGVVGCILTRCTLTSNRAAANGGGAYSTYLSFSVASNNVAGGNGGGTYGGAVNSCLVTGNSAANGGGTYVSSVGVSTIVKNQASVAAGGTYATSGANIIGSIIYNNSAPSAPNNGASSSGYYSYCCTTPAPPSSPGNITSDPAFVDFAGGNYRLQTNSPCINTGNGGAATDLDGRPRIVGGKIDIGAYEFQGAGIGEFIAWLQQHGLPTSGTADYTDSDRDGLNNWQEWLAGTDPTNSTSVLTLLTPSVATDGTGTLVSWQSVSNRTYFVQRSQDLLAPTPFSAIQSNIIGQLGTTSYLDTNAPTAGPVLYRVGVQ